MTAAGISTSRKSCCGSNNLAADQVIRKACAKAGVTVGKGVQPADLDHAAVDRLYAVRHYQRCAEHLHVCDRQAVPPPCGRQRPAGRGAAVRAHQGIPQASENIAAFDITWALGKVSGEDSIGDTYNAVVIAAEDDGKAYIGAQASNAASIKRYGFMQHIETVTENPGTAVLGQMVKNLLKNADKGRGRPLHLRDLGL